jgi:hypothetical protein
MTPFGVDSREKPIFQQFSGQRAWASLAKITGLPWSSVHQHRVDTPYNIPISPTVSLLLPTLVEDVYNFFYSAEEVVLDSHAKSAALHIIKVFIDTAPNIAVSAPELVAFASYAPYRVALDAQSIAKGTWHEIYALYGHRGTWYTGCDLLLDRHRFGIIL